MIGPIKVKTITFEYKANVKKTQDRNKFLRFWLLSKLKKYTNAIIEKKVAKRSVLPEIQDIEFTWIGWSAKMIVEIIWRELFSLKKFLESSWK